MNKAVIFTAMNFEEKVLRSAIPVLVDFWGSWCPPCKMMEPIIDALSDELRGKVTVGKCNVDQNPSIQRQYEVLGAPSFLLFKNGKIIAREVGARSKEQLLKMINNAISVAIASESEA